MAAHKSSVATSKFELICKKLDLEIKVKSGSFKVWPKSGSIKKSMDITTSKKGQTVQIILVGFESNIGTIPHPKPPADTVTQMLDFSLDEKEVLRNFFLVAKSLVAACPPANKEAPASTPAPAPAPVLEEELFVQAS